MAGPLWFVWWLGYWMIKWGIMVWYEARTRDFLVSKEFRVALGLMPPSPSSVGTRSSFPRSYQPEHEAYCIPPSSTEVKNEWSCYSASPYTFMACTGVTLLLMVTEHEQLLCWTQQRSRSIFLMLHLYYAKCYHMRHNTEERNPVHNSTVPRYATVNTSHSNILAIKWCVILLGPVNRIQKHDNNPWNCNSPNEDMCT